MPILSRRIPYDRKRMLARAAALEGGWRWRRALVLYRQILAAEPHNGELHARAAPLLARSGRCDEAWESFRQAAEACETAGDEASAYALRQTAVRVLPRHLEACRALARAELRQQRRGEALRALHAASRRMGRGRAGRGAAIVLLRDARAIEPWHPEIVLALSRRLVRDGQRAEALYLLDHLDDRVDAERRCAVRGLTWRIEPSLRHSWRWLGAVLARRREAADGAPGSSGSARRPRTPTTRGPVSRPAPSRS